MRVVFAPDGFKGTLAADAVAVALAEGWREVDPGAEAVLRPMADGGEGTIAAFAAAVAGARRMPVRVAAPAGARGAELEADWLLLPPTADDPGGTGVVELASTAGIELYAHGRDPWRASTFAFGEAIAAALDHGVSRLLLAIGSSASTDGGAGMLAALGARFAGVAAHRPVGAADLAAITGADLAGLRPPPPGGVTVLTDVTSPLLGAAGSAAVFGPQKGFAPEELAVVDDALRRYAAHLPADPGEPGTGAAGGTGFALRAWGAQLVPGAPAVAERIGLAGAVAAASLVVTGEGRYDASSSAGKAASFVARSAADAGVGTALVAGGVARDADRSPFVATLALSDLAGSAEAAMADPRRWLRRAGALLAARSA